MQVLKKNGRILSVLTQQDVQMLPSEKGNAAKQCITTFLQRSMLYVFMYVPMCICACTCIENRLERYLPISFWGVEVGEGSKGREISLFTLYFSDFWSFTTHKYLFCPWSKQENILTSVYLHFFLILKLTVVVFKCVYKFFDTYNSEGGNFLIPLPLNEDQSDLLVTYCGRSLRCDFEARS